LSVGGIVRLILVRVVPCRLPIRRGQGDSQRLQAAIPLVRHTGGLHQAIECRRELLRRRSQHPRDDGKLVELAAWEPCAERLAGPNVDDAIALLETVREEMESRYRELLATGARKIARDAGLPLHMIACDELALYLTAEDRQQRTRFAELLRDLVAPGRAAGIIVILATQKPAAEVGPSALRDLFGFRLAMRCTTLQAFDTILGQGWASLGHNAATIAPPSAGPRARPSSAGHRRRLQVSPIPCSILPCCTNSGPDRSQIRETTRLSRGTFTSRAEQQRYQISMRGVA
jgi:hypothetical protein